MNKTIHTISDKVLKITKKVNTNKSSKYFGKNSAVIECENNKIFVQDDRELLSEETFKLVSDGSKIVGKTCVFHCIKVIKSYFLTGIDGIENTKKGWW